jgi:hypothetical protein
MIGCSLGTAAEAKVAEPVLRRASAKASRSLLVTSPRPLWRRRMRAMTQANSKVVR